MRGLAIALALIGTPAMAQTAAPVPKATYTSAPWWIGKNVIPQTGQVFIEVPANRAAFSASFLSTGKTAAEAQAQAVSRTRGLNEVLGKLGRDKVVISTSFSMRPLYEQYRDKNGNRIENQRGDKIESYEVTLTVSIDVRDLSQLERAYALVMAASPTSASDVSFSLQPDNKTIAWLNGEAIKDARARATQAAQAAGGHLGAIQLIDPTGRACDAGILAPAPEPDYASDNDAYSDQVVTVRGARKSESYGLMAGAMAPPPPPAPGSAEYIEAQALKNPFLQTPPLQQLTAVACVVYGLN